MSFWVLAAWAVAMVFAVAVGVPEALPAERRHEGGLRQLRRSAGQVLGRPGFGGYLVVMALSMASPSPMSRPRRSRSSP